MVNIYRGLNARPPLYAWLKPNVAIWVIFFFFTLPHFFAKMFIYFIYVIDVYFFTTCTIFVCLDIKIILAT